jgi:hypothetical protein
VLFDSMTDFLMIGSLTAKAWYLFPLIVSISLVYGGTRHEHLSEILAHAMRSAIWLLVFLFVVFSFVWLAGFGVEAEELTPSRVNLMLAGLGWIFATLWIAGHAFKTSNTLGLACIASAGIFALIYGIRHRHHLYFPLAVMGLTSIWAIISAVQLAR